MCPARAGKAAPAGNGGANGSESGMGSAAEAPAEMTLLPDPLLSSLHPLIPSSYSVPQPRRRPRPPASSLPPTAFPLPPFPRRRRDVLDIVRKHSDALPRPGAAQPGAGSPPAQQGAQGAQGAQGQAQSAGGGAEENGVDTATVLMDGRYWQQMLDLYFVRDDGKGHSAGKGGKGGDANAGDGEEGSSSGEGAKVKKADALFDDMLFFVRQEKSTFGHILNFIGSLMQAEGPPTEEAEKAKPFFVRRWGPDLAKVVGESADEVDWRRSFYLNLICHTEFTLTVAICSRQDLEAHRRSSKAPVHPISKVTKRVFASPSKARIDVDTSKAQETLPSFPEICFAVDDYDNTFEAVVLEDPDHCFCVMLNAHGGAAFPPDDVVEKVNPDGSRRLFRRGTSSEAKALGEATDGQPKPPLMRLPSCASPHAPPLMRLSSCASPHAPPLMRLPSCASPHAPPSQITLFSGFVSYPLVRSAFQGASCLLLLLPPPPPPIHHTRVSSPAPRSAVRFCVCKEKRPSFLPLLPPNHREHLSTTAPHSAVCFPICTSPPLALLATTGGNTGFSMWGQVQPPKPEKLVMRGPGGRGEADVAVSLVLPAPEVHPEETEKKRKPREKKKKDGDNRHRPSLSELQGKLWSVQSELMALVEAQQQQQEEVEKDKAKGKGKEAAEEAEDRKRKKEENQQRLRELQVELKSVQEQLQKLGGGGENAGSPKHGGKDKDKERDSSGGGSGSGSGGGAGGRISGFFKKVTQTPPKRTMVHDDLEDAGSPGGITAAGGGAAGAGAGSALAGTSSGGSGSGGGGVAGGSAGASGAGGGSSGDGGGKGKAAAAGPAVQPLRCCLISLTLPWDLLAFDLLFKEMPIKIDIGGRVFPPTRPRPVVSA
ncbi:unnamed protein product [Closterium sp. NIES-65]|nr:unnamed protein product [Closterium sp. NIES-65]